jgi:hypothetical protein
MILFKLTHYGKLSVAKMATSASAGPFGSWNEKALIPAPKS